MKEDDFFAKVICFLFGMLTILLVFLVFVENPASKNQINKVIEHGCGQYAWKTGKFEWIKKN